MTDKEVLDNLMDVFRVANFRFLSLQEVTRQLQERGVYQNLESPKAMARVHNHLCDDRTLGNYPFFDIERGGEALWGLEWWLPKKKHRNPSHVQEAEPLHLGWEMQHTISPGGFEIESGTLPLRGQNASGFFASMDERQRELSIIELYCYGSEKLICAITPENRDDWILEGKALQYWYEENGIEPGDIIRLSVETINPLVIRIYTEHDRDADAYRRYTQRRNLESLPSLGLPIRDLIWLYFKRIQMIAHRADVAKAILADRPEISQRSVDSCLNSNEHLFVRVGEGNWGLKEWGIQEVEMFVRPKGCNPEVVSSDDFPKVLVPLEYVLANISAEDLVCKILRSAKNSLSNSQITDRISKYLGVDKSTLARTSFLNYPEDNRLVRLQDGTFTLRENLEEVIIELVTRERGLRQSLDQSQDTVHIMKDEMASIVAHYESQIEQLIRKERSEERPQLSQLLSKPYAVFFLCISRFTRNIIKFIHREAESNRDEEELL